METAMTTPSVASPKRAPDKLEVKRAHKSRTREERYQQAIQADQAVALAESLNALTMNQLRFLALRSKFDTDHDTCISIGVTQDVLVKKWKKNPRFMECYKLIEDGQHYTLGKMMYQFLVPLSAYRTSEMLDAEKEDGTSDWVTVSKGVELVQKGSGLTQDRDTAPANVFNTIFAQIKQQWVNYDPEVKTESSPVAAPELQEATLGRGEAA